MLRRLSLLLSLGLGCAVLTWGLFYLHRIFTEERDDALAAIDGRRHALEQYARKEIEHRLHSRLSGARPTIDAAARDPLIAASELWLVDQGRQVLPRTEHSLAGNFAPAAALYRDLVAGRAGRLAERASLQEQSSPWSTRLGLLADLSRALDAGDRAAISSAVRAILAERASYRIAATRDVPLTLAMLTLLDHKSSPNLELMADLLRDGLRGGGAQLEGLERVLLRNRARFTASDLQRLRDAIVELCRHYRVSYSDFSERVDEQPASPLGRPATVAGPMLLGAGRWYLEPGREGRLYGVRVRLSAMLDEIGSAMRERALVSDDAEVVRTDGEAAAPIDAVEIEVRSATWQPAIDAVHARYRLKAALEVVIAALVFGLMALGAWIYRRRHRFLELKSDFVSAVSHELRTPLASIRLMAETLERRLADVPKARDYPARIVRDIDALAFLIENILSFNRLSRGRWVPKIERVRLDELAHKLAAERDIWARREAELESEGLDEVEISADPDLLQLLLTNLLRNGCQYCERTPARLRIAARCESGWCIEVSDNGVGIAPGERERVFDDFFRSGGGEASGGSRGSGLGLAICRKIMEAHGGSIRVAASGPEGTTMALRFPPPAD